MEENPDKENSLVIQIKHISFSQPCKYFFINIRFFFYFFSCLLMVLVLKISAKGVADAFSYTFDLYCVTLEIILVVAQCAILVTEY
jgi:hypothetical protein